MSTHESLLIRLRIEPNDEIAWLEFVARYGPLIRDWCRSRRLSEADIDDVSQDVLTRLAKAMKTFSYDPSLRFRGWLRTVVTHAMNDYATKWKEQPRAFGGGQISDLIGCRAATEDLAAKLANAFDLEHLEHALALVQPRVARHNWQAFMKTTLEGRSIAETARELGLHEGMIYVARSKIQKMLRCQIQQLEMKSSSAL